MRILPIMLILVMIPFTGQAQNKVTGKIVDELGLPIYLAAVSLESSKEVVYTDYEGFFTLDSEKEFHWKVKISAAGYKTESFFVLSGGSAGEIELRYNEDLIQLIEESESP